MTAGDIISFVYTQVQRSKKTGVTVDAGKFGNFNTDDPQVIIQSPASETKPCFGIVPKNTTGEAIGQSPATMLTYASGETTISVLEHGIMEFLTTNAVTYQPGARVKVGTGGLPVLYVEGTDTDHRLIQGVVRGNKVVGNGTNTVQIEVGVK